MPRTPEQNQKIKDKRRDKILAVALRLFATQGYDAVTVDDITAACKCSHGLFYHYFDSKDDIFETVMNSSVLTGIEEPPYAEAEEKGGVKGLRVLCNYFEAAADKSDSLMYYAMIYVTLYTQRGLKKKPQFKKQFTEPMRLLIKLIQQGQEEGKVINGDPSLIALAFYDFIIGSITARVNCGRKAFRIVPSDIMLGLLLKEPVSD